MHKKIQSLGVGELLFGLVIVLGVVGTLSIFVFDLPLGISQETFIILSSLAFIGAFFVLSVYARWIKRSQSPQQQARRALQAWQAHAAQAGDRPLPPGTVQAIARHFFQANGYTPAGQTGPGSFVVADAEGRTGLILAVQEPAPLTLREVVSFYEALRKSKASMGEIWAPGGFSDDAAAWAARKPITLVDQQAIQGIVDSLPQP